MRGRPEPVPALTGRRSACRLSQHQRGSVISMDKDELLERYEALGENENFLAAKPLFEAEIRRREQSEAGLPGPEASPLLRQSAYPLGCSTRLPNPPHNQHADP